MNEELSNNDKNKRADDKELTTIRYFDRINQQWIDVEVTKEVARFMNRDRKNRKRHQDKYDHYNKQSSKVFVPSKPYNEKFLLDENSNPVDEFERKEEERLAMVEREEQRVIIENAMDSLTPQQQEVVKMAFYDNMSYSEIAAELGITKTSVHERMKNAEKNIKKWLYDTGN